MSLYSSQFFYKRLYQPSLLTKFRHNTLGANVKLVGPLLMRYETLRARRSLRDPTPSQHPSVAKPRPLDDAWEDSGAPRRFHSTEGLSRGRHGDDETHSRRRPVDHIILWEGSTLPFNDAQVTFYSLFHIYTKH